MIGSCIYYHSEDGERFQDNQDPLRHTFITRSTFYPDFQELADFQNRNKNVMWVESYNMSSFGIGPFSLMIIFLGFLQVVACKNSCVGPGWCCPVDLVLACEPKGDQFDSQSGHMPGLQAGSPVGGMWEATTVGISLLLFLPPSPSL